MKKSACIILSSFLVWGCLLTEKKLPHEVAVVLTSAGKNKSALQKVIRHYQSEEDSVKLKATYYLIEHSTTHFSYKGAPLTAFDDVFNKIEAYEKVKKFEGNIHFPVVNKWIDSVVQNHGLPMPKALEKSFDHQEISAELLIENIDYAFKAWKLPWAKHLNFEQFCHYILPYRFQNEQLENWRPIYFNKFSWLLDSMGSSTDPVKACALINNDIKRWFRFNEGFFIYPSSLSPIDLLKTKMGRCLDQAAIANFAMRAMGIPVAHEVIPQWGDRSMGHDFSSVLSKEGKFIDFLGGELNPGENEIRNKAPKIFRQFFAIQRPDVANFKDLISDVLGSPYGMDVTATYTNVTDVFIHNDKIEKTYRKKEIFLAVFNNKQWIPVDLGTQRMNGYIFKSMAREIMYLPCIISNNNLIPISMPFYIDLRGDIQFIRNEATTRQVRLDRKYPLSKIKLWWMTLMGGGIFEGANNKDFSDKRKLFIVPDTITLSNHISKVNTKNNVRYVRYKFPSDSFGSLGELAFYNEQLDKPLKGSIIKSGKVSIEDAKIAFDGKLDAFIHTLYKDDYNEQWIGLDLGHEIPVSYIGYSPRSDQNTVKKGNQYELLYWENKWNSLGRQIAGDHGTITFGHVPVGALLLLKNHTEGKEERIFIYEKNKQVWF